MTAALGTTTGSAQWTLSAFLLGFAFGQLLLGPTSDRVGRRPVLISGLLLYSVAGAAATAAPSIDLLILLRFFQGFGACAGVVISRAVVRDIFEGDEAVAHQSLLSAAASVAMLLAPIIGALLLGSFGWRATYGALAIAGMALLVTTLMLQPETLSASRRSAGRVWIGYLTVLHKPRVLGYAAVNALTFGGLFAYISASPSVFIGTLGVTPNMFSLLFALAAFALLAGSVLNGLLARRLSTASLERIGPAFLGFAVILLGAVGPITANVPLLICVLAVYAFAAGVVAPNAVAAGLAPLPEAAGAAAALIGFSQMIVGAISAAVIGIFVPGTVVGMVDIMVAFGMSTIAMALWLEIGRTGR